MVVHLNQTQGTVEYNGHNAKVVSESSAYITVVTEEGARVSVPRNSALLSFANGDSIRESVQNYQKEKKQELDTHLDENKSKIEDYKSKWNIAKKAKDNFIAQIGTFWKDLNLASGSYDRLNQEQSEQISFLTASKYDAISAMHRASSGVHSTVLDSLSAITSFRAMT